MRRETSSRTNGQAGAAAGLRRGINDAVLLRKLLEGTAVFGPRQQARPTSFLEPKALAVKAG